MRLKKYYFDLISPDGTAMIVYSAQMQIGPMIIPYGAVLLQRNGENLVQSQRLSEAELMIHKDAIQVEHSDLSLHGIWEGGTSLQPQVLYSSSDGVIRWECLSLNACTEVHFGGDSYQGTGYAECTQITVPIWRLPMDKLYWGRWISDDGTSGLTWIRWEGRFPLSMAINEKGERFTASPIENGMRLGGTELLWKNSVVLRAADVSDSVLGRLSALHGLLPFRLRKMREEKYIASATLGDRPGSLLFEEVTWI